MDKETLQEFAERCYNQGGRAFIQHSNLVYVFPSVWGNHPFECLDTEKWHALRAYQDAERKKGVPIVMTIPEAQANWFHLDCHHDGILYNFHAMPKRYGIAPEITVGHDLAKFTNFRWRAGYPKEKTAIQLAREAVDKPGVHWPGYQKKAQSDHCGGTSCPFEYSCVDGCMYPKGGQNG